MDKLLGLLQEARATGHDLQQTEGASRELAIVLTHIQTAILFRQEDLRLKKPTVDETNH